MRLSEKSWRRLVGLLDASALALLLGSFCVTKRWWSDANGTSKALRCQRITEPSEHPIYVHSHATRFTLSMDLCLAVSFDCAIILRSGSSLLGTANLIKSVMRALSPLRASRIISIGSL
jgi:hypothetical protein